MRALLVSFAASGLISLAVVGHSSAQEYFNGDPCTVDCSGHQAGADWAEQNNITDPSDCNGNSNSFNEGCETYVEENSPSGDEEPEEGQEEGGEADY